MPLHRGSLMGSKTKSFAKSLECAGTKIYPHYSRGERRFGLLPTVMRSQTGVGHGCNQYARSYRPPAAKQEEKPAAPLAGAPVNDLGRKAPAAKPRRRQSV
jgi:hypothetical protein